MTVVSLSRVQTHCRSYPPCFSYRFEKAVKQKANYCSQRSFFLQSHALRLTFRAVRGYFLSVSLTSGSKLGVYEILSPLGAGGMGEVYRARDTKLGREVAIKVLPEAFSNSEEKLARFEREARLLASLNHPNVATLYGLEKEDGVPFLAMELVEGETLGERIGRGSIPLDEALPFFTQIAAGLEAAHEKGIVHRDLKPANIKVTPEGKVKVLDFGLGKAMAGETRLLPETEGRHFWEVSWFPDGTKLLATGPSESGDQVSLYAISILGGAPRKLRDNGWRGSVSPDGSRIVYLNASPPPSHEVWLMDANGSNAKIIASGKDRNFWQAAWTPDGQRVLYGALRGRRLRVVHRKL